MRYFFRNRAERELLPPETEAIRQFCRQDVGRLATGDTLGDAIARKFAASNVTLCREHRSNDARLCMRDGVDRSIPRASIEKVFSFETYVTLQEVADLEASAATANDPASSAKIEQRVRAWRSWIGSPAANAP
ncbi:hypothetical protein [Paraburkholderia diazotrophica]|uniref:hypothetical protein n=1 Tax=Paraburkholderia diazotrophica TaxID=667676 RepID=UPI0031821FF7